MTTVGITRFLRDQKERPLLNSRLPAMGRRTAARSWRSLAVERFWKRHFMSVLISFQATTCLQQLSSLSHAIVRAVNAVARLSRTV